MAQAPAPAPGQDGEPAPPDGAVPPDWMDDQTWDLTAAACVTEDLPEEWDDDPQGSVPADWAVISVAELAAQAEADGAGHQALMARLIAAGVGEGYAHRRGDPPVPGVVSGPGAGFGQGRCLDQMTPEPGLAVLADEAAGEDRAFTGVTDDQLLGLLGAAAAAGVPPGLGTSHGGRGVHPAPPEAGVRAGGPWADAAGVGSAGGGGAAGSAAPDRRPGRCDAGPGR
jgi:hypothetical protein